MYGIFNDNFPPILDGVALTAQNYALLPVWHYIYKYHGNTYHFYLNGQTGKLVGNPPVAWGKVAAYGLTVFAGVFAMAFAVILAVINWG